MFQRSDPARAPGGCCLSLAVSRAVNVLALFAFALAVAGILFLLVVVVRRVVLAREGRQLLAAEERLRPIALQLLDEEAPLPPLDLSPAHAELFAELLGRYARGVRGSGAERRRVWFTESGTFDRTLARLESSAGWKRATAAYALGDMGSADAAGPLLRALEDDDDATRAAAARSLGRLGIVDAVEPLLAAQAAGRVPRLVVGHALLSIGSPALPRLMQLVSAVDDRERAAAVELVGLIGGAVDAGPLLDALRDASAEVRSSAAHSLGRLGADEAAYRLRQLLDDRIGFVRAAAAVALGEIGDEEAVARLRELALHDEFEPARAAAHSLGRIDPALVRSGGGPFLDEAADLLAL